MTEDKDRARRMAEQDMRSAGRASRKMFGAEHVSACSYENMADWPEGDGERTLIPVVIGTRDKLTKNEARHCAAMWREATRRYPKAGFNICLLGYDQDPREVWEFPDAARYVRWWARFTGMDDPETADRYLGTGSPMFGDLPLGPMHAGMVFLAACGCFGEALRTARAARLARDHGAIGREPMRTTSFPPSLSYENQRPARAQTIPQKHRTLMLP